MLLCKVIINSNKIKLSNFNFGFVKTLVSSNSPIKNINDILKDNTFASDIENAGKIKTKNNSVPPSRGTEFSWKAWGLIKLLSNNDDPKLNFLFKYWNSMKATKVAKKGIIVMVMLIIYINLAKVFHLIN